MINSGAGGGIISLVVVVSLVRVEVEGVDVHIYGFRVRVEHYGSRFGFKVYAEVIMS